MVAMLGLLLAVTGAASSAATTMLYVSPTGSASGTGTKDAPLASCAAAVKKLSMTPLPASGVTVQFAPGTYPLTNATTCGTLKGLKGTATGPVVLKGAPSGGTIFDAAVQLDATQLKKVTDPRILKIINPTAKTKVLAMPMAAAPGTLSWGGVPLTGSVWPNKGLGYVAKVNDKGAVWTSGRTIGPRPHCRGLTSNATVLHDASGA